jgi:hypothetical protein
MAERIIYRGRQRATKPYPFQVDVDAIPDTTYSYFLFGPLTLDELMEFKYRIKKFTVSGSIVVKAFDFEGNTYNETIDLNYDIIRSRLIVRQTGGGIGGSGGFFGFKTEAFDKESEVSPSFVIKRFNYIFSDIFYKEQPDYLFLQPSLVDMSSTFSYKTNEGYYLPISIQVETIDGSGNGFGSVFRGEEEFEEFFYTDCQLKVRSKTHNIRCIVRGAGRTVVGGSLTIEASEWYPYANADEQPIWNTSTGARTTNPFT